MVTAMPPKLFAHFRELAPNITEIKTPFLESLKQIAFSDSLFPTVGNSPQTAYLVTVKPGFDSRRLKSRLVQSGWQVLDGH